MNKTLAYTLLTATLTAGMALGTGGAASAAHCAEGTSPGFSYFGQEGREKNVPTPGASACPTDLTAGDPSERAPGQLDRT